MKLNYCHEDLTPRQDLQWLSHEALDLRDHLWELVFIDSGLRGSRYLMDALTSLNEASASLSHLRTSASDINCATLAGSWHATLPIHNIKEG